MAPLPAVPSAAALATGPQAAANDGSIMCLLRKPVGHRGIGSGTTHGPAADRERREVAPTGLRRMLVAACGRRSLKIAGHTEKVGRYGFGAAAHMHRNSKGDIEGDPPRPGWGGVPARQATPHSVA